MAADRINQATGKTCRKSSKNQVNNFESDSQDCICQEQRECSGIGLATASQRQHFSKKM